MSEREPALGYVFGVVPPGAGAAAGALSLFVSVLASDFVSLAPPDSVFAEELAAAGLLDEYKSAYQPPPFKMKLPPLICR